jgi:hypothetical protein
MMRGRNYLVRVSLTASVLFLMVNVESAPVFLCMLDIVIASGSGAFALVVLCFDADSCAQAWTNFPQSWAVVTQISGKSKYLENEFYYDVYPSLHKNYENYSYVGVVAYKAREKVIIPDNLPAILNKSLRGCEVVEFPLRMTWLAARKFEIAVQSVLHAARTAHGDIFWQAWNHIFEAYLEVPQRTYTSSELPKIHFNYWIAEPRIMLAYCTFARDLKRIMDSAVGTLRQELEQPVSYAGGARVPRAFAGGWTLHPFLCERFLPVFLLHYRALIRVCQLKRNNKIHIL